MNKRKLTLKAGIVNDDYRIELSDYDHYIGLEWSKSNMAVARLTQKKNTNIPQIIESGSDIKALKLYILLLLLVGEVQSRGKGLIQRHEV